jgi:hypothetical protein
MPASLATSAIRRPTDAQQLRPAYRLLICRLLNNLSLSAILIIFICGWLSTTYAQSKTQLTPAETAVLNQVALGKEADLQPFAQGADQRRGEISAEFLVSLLVNEDKKFIVTPAGIMIKNAVIRNQFNLDNRTIPYNMTLTNCLFQDDASFRMSDFQQSLTIKDSIFAREVNFSYLKVTYYVDLTNTHFNGKNKVHFENMKIGGDFSLPNAEFKNNADFTSTVVDIKLDLSNANFVSEQELADFDGINVDSMTVQNTTFQGTVSFWGATIKRDLNLSGAKFLNPEKMAVFSGTKIGHELIIDKCVWLASTSILVLNDLTYQNIVPDGEPALNFIRRSTYNEEAYEHLEDYYKRLGRTGEADNVYIEYRWRQTEKAPWYERIGSYLLYKLVGYGRKSWHTLVLSLIFIGAGTIIFWRKQNMETQSAEEQHRYQKHYSPFWYSLATFLPFVQLEDAEIWRPRASAQFARIYLRIHIILGYLLVPIGLAAWTGIIK